MRPQTVTVLTPLCLLAACADTGMSFDAGSYATGATSSDAAPGDDDDDGDDGTSTPGEVEDDLLALPPAQTERFVFVANPDRDTVTRIDVRSLAVDTTAVGDGPELVLTTPDWRTAVVFNRLASSVTLLDASSLAARTVPVRDNFNDMVMSPDGGWVVLFHNAAKERADDPVPDGIQSFNEASFVNVITGEHFPMAVGFDPRMVRFAEDSGFALIVSDAKLGDAPTPRLIELQPDVINPPSAEEVVVSPSGAFAFVRQFGASSVLVVDLDADTVDAVPVGANPTDLDLSPDGEKAVVVARDARELWVFDADDPFAPAEVLPFPDDLALGSLIFDPTGEQAVLYATASLIDRFTTWDLRTNELRTRALVKPVTSMAVSPTGETLLAFHTLSDAPGAAPSPFTGAWALTLFDLDDFRSNPLKLPAEPTGYANAFDGRRGYFVMEGQPFLEVLDYATLLPTEIRLASEPVYVGVLPPLPGDDALPPAWVSQDHALGRISFYNPVDENLETVTGFELNAAIE